ncbi:MAG: primosomal protein N' [Candidatus Sumerlaeia bacterium]
MSAARKDTSSPSSSGKDQTLFANVAVNLPIYQTYTYRVPAKLQEQVGAGSMVEVPVLNRKEQGVVVGLSDKADIPVKRIKYIKEVLTPDYRISAELLHLAGWMGEYYLGSLGETLACISFFGLRHLGPATERRLVLAEPEREDMVHARDGSKLTPRQREIAQSFLKHFNKAVTRAELMRREKCSAGIINTLLQKGVLVEQEVERVRVDPYHAPGTSASPYNLTDEQADAHRAISEAIDAERFEVFMLYGITGSGKTEIYLQCIDRVLQKGQQAIALVPEISLTPQAVERFRARFGMQVGVYHSRMTPAEKLDLWKRIDRGQVNVLIGARSAVFAPFERLGLVVVDEEHEHTYKQAEPAPRYHARDVGIWRARQSGIPVILGSATPSLESVYNCQVEKYRMLQLSQRVGNAKLPDIRLIDMGSQVREEGETGLVSSALRQAIEARLERGEQSILFLNRRGFSNFMLCMSCKTPIRCNHCDVVMTWHKAIQKLVCHFCGAMQPRPLICPECGEGEPAEMGAGTQRIEEEVCRIYPEARVLRVDLDTAGGRHGFINVWDKIEKGDYDILLGTQMIAKGLHLENVTLVGVISADHMLFMPDFRSAERTFAMLTQVAGRAGRMLRRGEVLIQSYIPHHYAIQRAIQHDTEGFWKQEMHIREMMGFPPYCRFLLVRMLADKEDQVRSSAQRLAAILREACARGNRFRPVKIYGPAPSPISRLRDKYRWQIVLSDTKPSRLRGLLELALDRLSKEKGHSRTQIILDMDPMDLL